MANQCAPIDGPYFPSFVKPKQSVPPSSENPPMDTPKLSVDPEFKKSDHISSDFTINYNDSFKPIDRSAGDGSNLGTKLSDCPSIRTSIYIGVPRIPRSTATRQAAGVVLPHLRRSADVVLPHMRCSPDVVLTRMRRALEVQE